MAKKYEVESLNYTDTCILIDALKDHINKGKPGKYSIDLLLKLERNKRVLYDTTPKDDEAVTTKVRSENCERTRNKRTY